MMTYLLSPIYHGVNKFTTKTKSMYLFRASPKLILFWGKIFYSERRITMAGHLSSHPYIKTFDEVQRSAKRQEQFIEMHGKLLDSTELYKAHKVVDLLLEAIKYIPGEYKLTKHDLKKLKEQESN